MYTKVTEHTPNRETSYTYDDNGNLVKQSGETSIDYSYDKENHLLRATIQKGNSVTVEAYTYDYAGNRTSKTINESNTTYYVSDTSATLTMVVAETNEAGEEIASYTRGEELLSMEKGGQICYYLYDGHGSVRALTNEAGEVTDQYSYDAYGNLLEKEGSTENEFLYTGEQYNANTGLYYLRARYMIWEEFNHGKHIMMNMVDLLLEQIIMQEIKRKEFQIFIIIYMNGDQEKIHCK